MPTKIDVLKEKLKELTDQWRESGLPGRQTLMDTAQNLIQWKKDQNLSGLWQHPPVFATATLDDAWGHGLELIETFARVLGMAVVRLGLEKSTQDIIAECLEKKPDYLGMTVLQFDSEDELYDIRHHIPDNTKIIAGGPIFKSDPDIAKRAHLDFVAKDVTAFIDYFIQN